jgi:pimeloyl-ACP methyl ester carboxylesterase
MQGGGTAQSLDALAGRYLSDAADGLVARVRVHAGPVSRDFVLDESSCRVDESNGQIPDAEITTDAETWLAIERGRMSGIEAFVRNRLWVRGSLEISLRFETLFERPTAGGLRYDLHHVDVRGMKVSTLAAGDPTAQPLLLLHGLGATKASWLTVVADLARNHFVVAPDLPGFGASEKPAGAYDAPWFASLLLGLLDGLGLERARVVGNSMGGRIALEMAMMAPSRIEAVACLCPAAAFEKRPGLWLVKISRPQVGYLLTRLPRRQIKAGMRQLFADPSRLDDVWYDAAIDDFLATWRAPRARHAFVSALRNIYLDEPFGEAGFWRRLGQLEARAMFVYGAKDVLIKPSFGEKVRRALPSARVEIWDDCGHVPQIEHPRRTAAALREFFGS